MSSHDIPHMDHVVLFGGSAVAIAHNVMSESGVPEYSSFESSGM